MDISNHEGSLGKEYVVYGDTAYHRAPVAFTNDRTVFAAEDPRVMPLCGIDMEVINRIEDERWFGK